MPITGNTWIVDVVRAGYFSVSSSGNTINYLRIDMQVAYMTSVGGIGSSRVFYMVPNSIAVRSPNAQYQFDSADSILILEYNNIVQGYPVTGYWIFQIQGTLDPLNSVLLAFAGGTNSGDTWSFQL